MEVDIRKQLVVQRQSKEEEWGIVEDDRQIKIKVEKCLEENEKVEYPETWPYCCLQ